jgi:lipid-A-disaccharide synthase
MSRVLLVAGEASGDLHAARLLRALQTLRPEVEAFGLGGEELEATGMELLAHSAEVAVVGITEALKVLPRAREIFRLLLQEVERRRPTVAVLVDFAEFNLRLACALAERGIPVVYYISPQVWAWRRRRVKTIARCVDRMLVLLPFEADFYRRHGVEVEHVGHPLVDEVPHLTQRWDVPEPLAGPRRLVLMPGSRRSEVQALLPTMLETATLLAEQLPLEVQLVQASMMPDAAVDPHLAYSELPVERVREERFRAVAGAHLVLCASGTATLEVGLLGTPMIVLYRLHLWSYLLARLMVRIPAFSLVNLVLGEQVVPELMQSAVSGPRVAAEALPLLTDAGAVAGLRRRLAPLRERLGAGGASQRAARRVAEVLEEGVG